MRTKDEKTGRFNQLTMEEIKSTKYGKLTVISEAEPRVYTYRKGFKKPHIVIVRFMNCKCDCGNKFVARLSYLTSGASSHCGCVKRTISDEQKYAMELGRRARAEAKKMEK